MNKNPKIFMLVAVIILTSIIGLFVFGDKKKTIAPHANASKKESLYDTDSADTNNETLRTLIAHQQQLERENKVLQEKNEALTSTGLHEYKAKFEQEKRLLNQQFNNEKKKLLSEIHLSNKAHQALNAGKNYLMEGADDTANKGAHIIGDVMDMSHPPVDIEGMDIKKRVVHPSMAKPELPAHFEGPVSNDEGTEFYYTIPANATLARTTLMTNIIAEVPVAGKLIEPAMPFKAIIGRKDLLASNGMILPEDLGGIVISGYSVGNMSLSCARMYVTQVLFTFQDGTFTVYPKENKLGGNEIYPKEALGYLSDLYGNVCLTGLYITDAPQVIASLAAFGGISGFGEYAAQSQMTTYVEGDGSATQMTGDAFKYGLGNSIGTGADMAMRWYTQRVSDIFDAVYIPKMQKGKLRRLVFNVTQTIPIDISLDARKLYFDHDDNLPPASGQLD